MKRIFKIVIIFFLFACEEEERQIELYFEKEVPQCIEENIRRELRKEFGFVPASIWEWKAGGKTYYYFRGQCCDWFNELYDENCNVICAPDGGLSGNGFGTCPDLSEPVEKTLVWDNPDYE